MDVNIKIGFDERAQTLLEGFYASVGRLLERTNAAGCTKCEEKHAKALKNEEELSRVEKNEEELSRTEKAEDKKEPEGTGEVAAAVPSAPSVPTAEVAYSFEEIQLACAELVRAGKREDLAKLIREFGLSSLPELAKEQYNEFALNLRAIGGTI